jgi:iron(II)-dependent oxidoreductase
MHDLVVRDLEQARNRTLGLTDLDDPTLVTQHDPLMSPLVWDLAHVGQQEELWLLRAGGPARPGMLPPADLLLTDGRRIIATRWNDILSIPRAPAAAASSRASPITTTRAGPTSPTITSSTWPAAW